MKIPGITRLAIGLEIEGRSLPVGTLAWHERQVLFEYDTSFLTSGLEISPFRLRLGTGVRPAGPQPFQGLFGVFDDSLPDSYGRLLLDRRLVKKGIAPGTLNPLDRLALVGTRGFGALVYTPEEVLDDADVPTIDLDQLQDEALAIIAGEPSEALEALQKLGGTAGGARPKILIWLSKDRRTLTAGGAYCEDAEPWIIKFRAPNDDKNLGVVEHAYGLMAEACGLETEASHVFPSTSCSGHFGARRFDLGRSGRLHMHSLAGLLHADPQSAAVGYLEFIKATLALTRNMVAAEAAFRRMAFNVLAHNRDDHSRNHAFLMNAAGEWRLAPAYDLTFSDGPGGEHYLIVDTEGRNPGRANMLAVARKAGIAPARAAAIIDEVRAGVADWKRHADKAGVAGRRSREIGARLNECDRP